MSDYLKTPPMRPSITDEGRENQLIALAIDAAEKQLREGTASAQVITHFLKLGSTKERIEKEILEKQRDLIAAKTKSIESNTQYGELELQAINAMREYTGKDKDDSEIE